eukprot:5536620-Prymnesium_polylepis.1
MGCANGNMLAKPSTPATCRRRRLRPCVHSSGSLERHAQPAPPAAQRAELLLGRHGDDLRAVHARPAPRPAAEVQVGVGVGGQPEDVHARHRVQVQPARRRRVGDHQLGWRASQLRVERAAPLAHGAVRRRA